MRLLAVLLFLLVPQAGSALVNQCTLDYKAKCDREGYVNFRIFGCSDWTGELEICVRCTYPGSGDLFAGCGGLDDRLLNPSKSANQRQCPKVSEGSIVYDETLTLMEVVPIVGTSDSLVYGTNRGLGRKDDYVLHLPISGPTLAPGTTEFEVRITYAGRTFQSRFPAKPNFTYDFVWDGKDSGGKLTAGSTLASVLMRDITTGTNFDFTLELPIGNWKVDQLGLGGWSLSSNHFYDFARKRIYFGNGETADSTAADLGDGTWAASSGGSEIYIFSSAGRHLRTLASLTGTTLRTFVYTSAEFLSAATDPFGNVVRINRDGSGNFISITAPRGQVTTVARDTAGRLASLTNPKSEKHEFTYESSGLLKTFKKPTGEVSTFTYDALGNLLKDGHSGGAFLSFVDSIAVGARTLQKQTAFGRKTTYVEEPRYEGVYQTWTGPAGVKTIHEELAGIDGGVRTTTADIQSTTSFTEDVRFGGVFRVPLTQDIKNGTLIQNRNYSQSVSLADPDDVFSISTLTERETINGRVSAATYKGASRLWTLTSPKGRSEKVTIDMYQRPIQTQIGSQTAVEYSYDSLGRLARITQGTRVTEITYNPQGLVATVKNALGQITSYTYDTAGRLTQTKLPDLRVLAFDYDASGRLRGVTPASKPRHGLLYNALEILGFYEPPLLGGVLKRTEFRYNLDRQLTHLIRPDGKQAVYNYGATTGLLSSLQLGSKSYSYTYDATKGFLATATSPDALKTRFSYHGGLLSKDALQTSAGAQMGAVVWGYDRNFWPTSIVIEGNTSTIRHSLALTYDSDGLPTKVGDLSLTYQTAAPLVSRTVIGPVGEEVTYNSFGELTGRAVKYGTAAVYSLALQRDALGRVTSRAETIGSATTTFSYTYDSSGRLDTVKKNAASWSDYNFDGNGNRTTSTIGTKSTASTVDPQDRILTQGPLSFTYNDNGEVISRKNSATNQTWIYAYDELGQLKSVTLPDARVISYLLDGMGRRTVRKVGGTVTNQFLYKDDLHVTAEITTTGAIASRYVYASGSHSPDYMVRGATTYRFVKDDLGSIRLVVRVSDGVVVQRLDYDEYGRIMNDTSPGFQPFGFAGGLYDRDTKLVRFGARDYDPETGRWTSKDPILFNGGDTNLYGYVLNDPINLIDPNGESPIIVGATIGAFIGTFFTATPTDTPMGPFGEAGRVAAGAAAGAAVGGMCAVAATGAEVAIGGMRFAPFGNRTSNPTGQLPHYHRRTTDPGTGQTAPGQGIGRHRPWDTRSTDRSFWDRF